MQNKNLTILWDEPVPEGIGRSNKWRMVRAALNAMYTRHESKVAFRLPRGDSTEEEALHQGDLIRAAYYGWAGHLGKNRPDWQSTVIVDDDFVTVHVYDPKRLTEEAADAAERAARAEATAKLGAVPTRGRLAKGDF